MNILMGIGNEQGLDDGIGNYIAKHFSHPDWQVFNCGTVPENFTSVIKKAGPDYLVLVDAAHMEIEAGAIKRIPSDQLADVGAGTHALPLSIIINIMQPYVKQPIVFIGIEPKVLGEGDTLSPEIISAGDKVIQYLKSGKVDEIDLY